MKYIAPIKPSKAKGLVAKVYSQIKRDFGRIVEPFSLHSPNPSLLAGVWMASRESELVGSVSREKKEAIAASVSKLNQCPYCVDAHTIMIRATGDKKTARLIANEEYEKIESEKTRKVVRWALSTSKPNSEYIKSPPFEKKEVSEIIGTAVFYHYINPLVTIFLGDTPLPVSFFKPQMKSLASFMFKRAVNRPKEIGSSLVFLPSRRLPDDLSWASSSANIGGAYARLAGVFDGLEKNTIPQQTVQSVNQYLQNWLQKDLEFGLTWLKEETKNLDPKSRVVLELALLTINSPYKISKLVINEFQKYYPNQEQLLDLVTWASFKRARKVGSYLWNK